MTASRLREFSAADFIGHRFTPEQFLHHLAGPAFILQPGLQRNRCRAVVTLLHGNEPSGLKAIMRWLELGAPPQTDALFVIASVKAALSAPGFYYRMLPGYRDLNRCFVPPYEDSQGHLARDILQLLRAWSPEALLDIHNTSGSGPAFGVAVAEDPSHDALISLFSQRLVITSHRLGALMELSETDFPTITVECGGSLDIESDRVAWEGLSAYLREHDVLSAKPAHWAVEHLIDPLRLEVAAATRIGYAPEPLADMDITLRADIERFNFAELDPSQCLGWVEPSAVGSFRALDSRGVDHFQRLYHIDRQGCLRLRAPRQLFMITTNPAIAISDCLWYSDA